MSQEDLLRDVARAIEGCNTIRYPTYRTAAKVQILHRELHMQYVELKTVIGVFERHRLSVTENSVPLDETEIEDVISDIYFASHKESEVDFDVNQATKLAVNCVIRIFDPDRKGKVSVFPVKVFLTLLCCGKLQEKYEYLYQLLADHNACLSKAALHMLLTNVCKVTEMLGESGAYGSHLVQSSIDSCFIESQGCLGVSETEFGVWLMQEPPLLSWITTFNRLKISENTVHNIKCSTCKITPIHGPRFSCLRCARYHQCQTCFFLGKVSSKHKLKHPVREYCTKTSSKELTKLIVELIRNKLRLCPTQGPSPPTEAQSPESPTNEAQGLDTMSVRSTVRRRVLSDPQKELQSIINHLEEENRQLQVELMEICGGRAERLQQHRRTVESQLHRLKILKKYLFSGQGIASAQVINRVQSTPMLPPISSRYPALTLPEFELSPIIRQLNTDKHQHQAIDNGNESQENTYRNSEISRSAEGVESQEVSNTYSNTGVCEPSRIELSTWIGGNRSTIDQTQSGFSQWLNPDNPSIIKHKYSKAIDTDSPIGMPRDTPSSLQRPDKHSQHSSLQNIQGDLNDILNRLQHMVANDCLLEESFSANDNCELKRAATEMEDLLTGLIEGMESRKDKLATIV
ncbi:dystrophin-like [Diachasmimorpha longicaudata]|uniref:dystrophin-like n=1 Tax=Diachasmimorpha longicaudata TaxID=58733 RepID=UPI0030B88AC3